jgi:Nucleotidyl transferase AbiEii toxin, Type IV TA system
MEEFIKLPMERRRRFCDEAQAKLSLRAASIEKDFWVCWTLRELFSLPGCGPHLTFKGGTSLSKAWKLIERFSEDVDVVLDRSFLGFGGDKSPEAAASNNQREKRLEALKLACQKRIQDSLKPELEERFQGVLPKGMQWSLVDDTDDADRQTLLFHFPSAYGDTASSGFAVCFAGCCILNPLVLVWKSMVAEIIVKHVLDYQPPVAHGYLGKVRRRRAFRLR